MTMPAGHSDEGPPMSMPGRPYGEEMTMPMPCECAHVWYWEGVHHTGCLQEAGTMKYWCVTESGSQCDFAMPSKIVPGVRWMECPEHSRKAVRGWDYTTFEGGGMQHHVGMAEEEKYGRMRKTEHGRSREAMHKEKEAGMMFEFHGKSTRNTTYSKEKAHEVGEKFNKHMYEFMAKNHDEETKTQKWHHHGRSGHSMSKTWHSAQTHMTSKVDAARAPDEGDDCSFWHKILGYGADCVPDMHMSQGGDGRRLASMFV